MKNKNRDKKLHRIIRHRRVRSVIFGTGIIPRLNIFRSNKHIFAQLVDDEEKKTLFSVSDIKEFSKKKAGSKKSEISFDLGKEMAKLALEKNIKAVVFDRGGFKYHGRIKAFAEGARAGGLKF